MDNDRFEETDEEIHLRRMRRIEQMKREKAKAEKMRKKLMFLGSAGVLTVAVIAVIAILIGKMGQKTAPEKTLAVAATPSAETQVQATPVPTAEPTPEPKPVFQIVPFTASKTDQTKGMSDEIISEYGVVIDVNKQEILAARNAYDTISPASMTKILTVYTAAKRLGLTGEDWADSDILKDKFTITIEITDYSFVHDCSNVGFDVGEEVPVKDLFYGTILPSGADAAVGLADYVAGSHEAFVDMMNEELKELNLSSTSHFTNCVGLYDKNHYTTVYDMAVMLKAAMDIPFCREVLGERLHVTEPTAQHSEGLELSNWFIRRIEDKDTHGTVIGAKTGFVVQSKNCAASMAQDKNGKEYICVTAGSTSSWKCIYDQVALYQKWLPE
ncbi:MAG: D-alanyl-D-alanine carboxypeptidase [Acetatifactor sp.]|nr:D-alanyl-D-alanine carboxypeptidase [Acetatifactor sp.]